MSSGNTERIPTEFVFFGNLMKIMLHRLSKLSCNQSDLEYLICLFNWDYLQIHRLFDSRILINTRNELGIYFSYTVIQRYERCASVPFSTDIKCLGPGAFFQHMATGALRHINVDIR